MANTPAEKIRKPGNMGPTDFQITKEWNRNDRKNHPPNKDKLRIQYLDLKSSQTQMPKHQNKSKLNNKQAKMFPLESSYPNSCP